ncbi:unnamed protein product [Notodromas monacha]|uniref:EGF-like domain-containing protein n=1 Tax=Notodromas monacha TaxID=399045 RepID=A0A7R9BMC7_9CRUS|nr:unnamed protein product [Notodromas monacha]CAG0918165.1 unnamed protein product [Notodromas monacha]
MKKQLCAKNILADVNECDIQEDVCPQPNSACKNTVGSYVCETDALGFTESNNNVVESADDFYRVFKDKNAKSSKNLQASVIGSETRVICPMGYRFSLVKQDCAGEMQIFFLFMCNFPSFLLKLDFSANNNDDCHLSHEDVDECEEEIHTCGDASKCINTQGSFSCQGIGNSTCPAGFKWDPVNRNCKDVDECSEQLDNCKPVSETCKNTQGAYECELICPPGLRFNIISASCMDRCRFNLETRNIQSILTYPDLNYSLWIAKHVVQLFGFQNTKGKSTFKFKILPIIMDECVNTPGSYFCTPLASTVPTCGPGFAYNNVLKKCEDVNECGVGPGPCPGGVLHCVNTPGSYFCLPQSSSQLTKKTCPIGFQYSFSAKECIDFDECTNKSNICRNRLQTCINTIGSYVCDEKMLCGAGLEPNRDNTACVGNDDKMSICTQSTCQNGDCIVRQGKAVCLCHLGFQWDQKTVSCEDINECQQNEDMCLPSQRCDNTIGSFSCIRVTSCGTGYTLNSARNACEDDDECALGTAGCEALGPGFSCENTEGSFKCVRRRCSGVDEEMNEVTGRCDRISTPDCAVGFRKRASNPKDCEDINECLQYGICPMGKVCVNTPGSFRCEFLLKCGTGLRIDSSGTSCEDVNECEEGTDDCKAGEVCRNLPGTFACDCPSGFERTYGFAGATAASMKTSSSTAVTSECRDIDECQGYRGSQVCSRSSECENTIGSYRCNCKQGFKQGEDGRTCIGKLSCFTYIYTVFSFIFTNFQCRRNTCIDVTQNLDECTEVDNICQQKCVNFWGSYHCTCELGYKLNPDKRSCTDIDECEDYKAVGTSLCIGMCVNTPGSYKCSCPAGYKLSSDGRRCEDVNECHSNPCREDQICSNAPGSHRCHDIRCPPGYIRDTTRTNRCKLASTAPCARRDTECLKKPWSYSYNFLSLRANARIPLESDGADLFTMTGPRDGDISVHFSLDLESARAPPHVQAATRLHFRLKQNRRNEASVSLIRSLAGPQEIELQLRMDVVSDNSYGGAAVAKILIYISQFDY